MSHWLVYWVLMLNSINMLVFTIFIISIIASLSYFVSLEKTEDRKKRRKLKRRCNRAGNLALIFLLIFYFTPTTKQMVAIYLLPKIIANKDIQQLPPKLSKLALEYVNKELNLEEKK